MSGQLKAMSKHDAVLLVRTFRANSHRRDLKIKTTYPK